MSFINKYKNKYIKFVRLLLQNYMPRGLIFGIDVILIFIAAFSTNILVTSIKGEIFNFDLFPLQLFIVVAVQAGFMALFKSYSGIVRYSSLKDAAKQMQVVLICMVTMILLNEVYFLITKNKFLQTETLIVYGIIAFPLLFIFRVVVKSTYEIIRKESPTSRALIYGVSHTDITATSGLLDQKNSGFSVVGFLDANIKTRRNNLFGLPIYHLNKIVANRKPADAIIISEERLDFLRESDPEVLSELLDLKFKIFKLPKIQDWMNSQESDFDRLKEINIEDLLQRTPIRLNTDKLSSLYKDKMILVTGAAGSIGSEIVRQLIRFKPEKILLLDQAETPLHSLSLELCNNHPETKFEKIICNVRNRNRLRQIFEEFQPEIVFHAAAYKHVPMMEANPMEAISVNFYGTHNLSELSVEFNVERFILVSTDKAVNPTNIMGATKRSAELFVQHLSNQENHQTTFVTTRFGNVLGSNGSVVPYFQKQIAAGGPVTVTHPDITRYFMTIDEACQLVLEAGSMAEGGEIFVFDMGKPVKIKDLAYQMIRLSGRIPGKDIMVEYTGLRPGEKLFEELLADEENTTKTYHEKIMIGHATSCFNQKELAGLLQELLAATDTYEAAKAVKIMKKLVPEYKPPVNSEKNHLKIAY